MFEILGRLARTVASLAFAYARPALALALLVGPLVCTLLTLDTAGDPLSACCMLAVWGLFMAMHALPRDVAARDADAIPDGVSECVLVGLGAVKTLQILHASAGAHNLNLWLAVTSVAAASVVLRHVDTEWVSRSADYKPVGAAVPVARVRPLPTRVAFGVLGVVALVGLLRALVFAPSGADMATGMLVLAETAVCLVLMARVLMQAVPGMEELMLGMLFLHACTFPLMDLWSVGGILHMVVLGAMLVMTFVATAQIDPAASVLVQPWAIVEGVADVVVRLLKSTSLWQIVVLVSFGVVVRAMAAQWYTAHADFPEVLQRLARAALELIMGGPKLFMEITNRPEVQQFMVEVVPEIAAPRGLIYRILRPVIVSFEQGRDGIDYTLVPLYEFFAMLAFVVGPLVAAMGVLASVFASGAAFAKSRWFWAFAAWGCLLFAALTQLAVGPKVTAVALLFLGSSYRRVYTPEGTYALLGLLVLCGACLILFVVLSQTESEALRLLRRAQPAAVPGTSCRAMRGSRVGAGSRPDQLDAVEIKMETAPTPAKKKRVKRETPSCVTLLKRGLKRMTGLAKSPAFVLAIAGVAVIVFTVLLFGSPVASVRPQKIDQLPERHARWLKITTLDRQAAVESTFLGFLVRVFGSDVRLAFLLRFLNRYVIEQIQCLPCLCIPGISEIGGALGSVGNALRGLREFREPRQQAYVFNGTYAQSPLRRRTLFDFDPTQSCTRPSSSCDGYAVCLSDVINPIVDVSEFFQTLLLLGLTEAVKQLAQQVINFVPGFSQINNFFGSITLLNGFENFDPLDMADFGGIATRLPGVFFGALLHLEFPSLGPLSLSIGWLILLALAAVGVVVLLVKLGLMEPLVDSAFTTLGATIALSFLAGLVALVFLAYGAVAELRILGWELVVAFRNTPLVGVAIGFGVIVFACFLTLGAAAAVELEKTVALHNSNGTGPKARLRITQRP